MRRLFAFLIVFCLILGQASAGDRVSYITQYTHGDREKARIAITIDDWYEPDLLPQFLDVAEEYGVKLTLYPIGMNIQVKDGPLWQRAIDEGHEIGNHSNTHKNLNKASRESILAQLRNMEKRLEDALGHPYEVRTLRYPYGAGRNNSTKSAFAKTISEAGYTHVVLWDVDYTKERDILRKTKNGSIILLHGRKRDLRLLKAILPKLQEKGYEMVTVSDLLELDP